MSNTQGKEADSVESAKKKIEEIISSMEDVRLIDVSPQNVAYYRIEESSILLLEKKT